MGGSILGIKEAKNDMAAVNGCSVRSGPMKRDANAGKRNGIIKFPFEKI
jgi:hypothetical protein